MKLSTSRFEQLVSDNNRAIELYTKLVKEKQHILDIYGYEESGEEVSKYSALLESELSLKNDITNGKYN